MHTDPELTKRLNRDLVVLMAADAERDLPEPCRSSTTFGILFDRRGKTFWMSGRQVTEELFTTCRGARAEADDLHQHDAGGEA